MAAITSQTFHHNPSLSLNGALRGVAGLVTPVARWLAQGLVVRREPAAPRTRIHEAEAVRRLADGWLEIDPGFAADLYAAAARHESQDGR